MSEQFPQWMEVRALAVDLTNEAHRLYFEVADVVARLEDLSPEDRKRIDPARDKISVKIKPAADTCRQLYEQVLEMSEWMRKRCSHAYRTSGKSNHLTRTTKGRKDTASGQLRESSPVRRKRTGTQIREV